MDLGCVIVTGKKEEIDIIRMGESSELTRLEKVQKRLVLSFTLRREKKIYVCKHIKSIGIK